MVPETQLNGDSDHCVFDPDMTVAPSQSVDCVQPLINLLNTLYLCASDNSDNGQASGLFDSDSDNSQASTMSTQILRNQVHNVIVGLDSQPNTQSDVIDPSSNNSPAPPAADANASNVSATTPQRQHKRPKSRYVMNVSVHLLVHFLFNLNL